MRTIDAGLKAHLDSGATTLCRCWEVRRSDGVAMGFTNHDEDLIMDGVTFRADTGMDAGMIDQGLGLSVDNAQAVGALSSAAITEEDVLAGRYDGATVRHWLVNWAVPAERLLLFSGTLGEFREANGRFEIELRGLAEPLNRPLGRIFAKQCDRVLGDAKCGVDLDQPAFRCTGTVVAADAGAITFTVPAGYAGGWFRKGTLEWQSGANAGLRQDIMRDRGAGAQRRIETAGPPPLAVATGDTATLTAGCDKADRTCRDKFANLLNFRGFPHLPSDDWVTAYPSRKEVNDGGSLGGSA